MLGVAILVLVLVVILIFQIATSTAILVLGLWILGDEWSGPFKVYGAKQTWMRCAWLCSTVSVLGAVSVVILMVPSPLVILWQDLATVANILSIVIWFVGIMYLFERTFWQAVILTLVCSVSSFLVEKSLGMLAAAF